MAGPVLAPPPPQDPSEPGFVDEDARAAFLAWLADGAGVDDATDAAAARAEPAYHTPRGLFHALRWALEDHPEVGVERYGYSVQGRPLWAVHVPPVRPGPPDRRVLVFAGLHALEWIGSEVALATLRSVLQDRPEAVAVTVVLLANPDGRAKTVEDLAAGRDLYRRGNQRNVDLNRDFAVHRDARSAWAPLLPRRHAATRTALSQPETRALDHLVARHGYVRAASLHAFGGFLYYPWSGRWARPPHHAAFVALGRAMEAAQGPRAYKTRQLARWGFFFRAQGSEIDHLYACHGTLAFLVELTRSGIRPWRGSDWRTPRRWYSPVSSWRHVDQGVEAMRALIDTELPEGLATPRPRRTRGERDGAVGSCPADLQTRSPWPEADPPGP